MMTDDFDQLKLILGARGVWRGLGATIFVSLPATAAPQTETPRGPEPASTQAPTTPAALATEAGATAAPELGEVAHIFVCFLAYAMWKTLEQWQQRAGLGNSPRTILYELGHIQSTDVVLPLANDAERELRIRCVVGPDKAQAALLDRLGLRLPQRLRAPPSVVEM